jgi:tetratricopeptide (TPR) repeat protein
MDKYVDALKDAEKVHSILHCFSSSINGCMQTVLLKPEWAKGYGRMAAALFYLKRYEESRKAYAQALDLDPANVDFKKALGEVESQLTVSLSLERKRMCLSFHVIDIYLCTIFLPFFS